MKIKTEAEVQKSTDCSSKVKVTQKLLSFNPDFEMKLVPESKRALLEEALTLMKISHYRPSETQVAKIRKMFL